jgi:hypothetical protein
MGNSNSETSRPEITDEIINKYRHIEVDNNDWYEYLIDEWKEKLEDLGYMEPEISFSGFWSQGDGASFTCRWIDLAKWIKAHGLYNEFRKAYVAITNGDKVEVEAKVYRTEHRYFHHNSVSVDFNFYYHANLTVETEHQFEELEETISEEVKDLSREVYDDLQELYDYLTSDENVRESLENNDFWHETYCECCGRI